MTNMKIITLFLLLFTISSLGQEEKNEESNYEHPCLFEERSLTVGVSAPYSIDLNSPGLNLRMYYNVGESICFGPEYSYFKKGDLEIVDFDFVIHYIFDLKWIGLYPLLGANYTIELENGHNGSENHASPGLLIGGGIHRNFKNFSVFAEYSRVELGLNDQFIAAGLLYTIK